MHNKSTFSVSLWSSVGSKESTAHDGDGDYSDDDDNDDGDDKGECIIIEKSLLTSNC